MPSGFQIEPIWNMETSHRCHSPPQFNTLVGCLGSAASNHARVQLFAQAFPNEAFARNGISLEQYFMPTLFLVRFDVSKSFTNTKAP